MKRILPLLVVSLVVLLSAWFLYTRSQPRAAIYQTVQPAKADLVRRVHANGVLVPRHEVTIKPQISGVVQRLDVEPGDIVTAGQVVALLTPLSNPGNVSAAEGALREARLRRAHAERELKRVQQLHERKLFSESALRQQQLDFDVAGQQVATAERNLEIVKTGTSRSLGRSASVVRATIGGTVLQRLVEVGGFVIETNTFNEGTTIVSVADLSDLIFKGQVDEADAASLKVGMPLKISVGAVPGTSVDATLEFIAPKSTQPPRGNGENAADPLAQAAASRGITSFEIRAGLKPGHGLLIRAGYTATAAAESGRRDGVLSLEERAIRYHGDAPYALVETLTGVQERPLKLGLSDGLRSEIIEGLAEGDKVRVD